MNNFYVNELALLTDISKDWVFMPRIARSRNDAETSFLVCLMPNAS